MAIAYYLLLAIFPLLIAVGNLLPLLNIDPRGILDYLELVLPEVVQPVLNPIVEGLLTSSSGGLLSFGIIAAIWSSSRGVSYIRKGVNQAYGIPDNGSIIAKRLVSIVVILLMLLLLIAFVLIFGLGELLVQALIPVLSWVAEILHQMLALKWPVALIFLFLVLVIVYRVTPDVKLRLRDALPGAAFATAGLLVLVQAFGYYIQLLARSFSSYGALGTFFVLMFWLNFSAKILILGAVLNASIYEYRFGPMKEQQGRVDTVVGKAKTTLLQKWQSWRAAKKEKTRAEIPQGEAPVKEPPGEGAEKEE